MMWLNEKTERRLRSAFVQNRRVIESGCTAWPCWMPDLFDIDGIGARAVCIRCGKRMLRASTGWRED